MKQATKTPSTVRNKFFDYAGFHKPARTRHWSFGKGGRCKDPTKPLQASSLTLDLSSRM